MGRRSTRENKTVYQTARENAGLTREAAAEELVFISSDRIEKIESERSSAHPDEVLAMSECYKNAALCNYYCSNECPIGQKHVTELSEKQLSQITLEMLDSLDFLHEEKRRLVSIVLDGQITPDEMADFRKIHKKLVQMSDAISTYKLWLENQILSGSIDPNNLED